MAREAADFSVLCPSPTCRYPLRGLAGPLVTCPECGRRWDLAELARRQWKSSEEYLALARPAMLVQLHVLCSPFLALGLFALGVVNARSAAAVAALWVLGAGAYWLLLVSRALRRAPVGESLALVAGLHVVMIGYVVFVLVAMYGYATVLVLVLVALVEGEPGLGALGIGLLLPASGAVALLVALGRLDRSIGRRCLPYGRS